jgi:hypothetical protein
LNNLIQKWIIFYPRTQSFITGSPFNYTQEPELARIYHNYSDAIMACNNHYNKEFGEGHYPIELRFHFNNKTLMSGTQNFKTPIQ